MSIAEKLTTIAENQQKVYDAGFLAGQAGGGYERGYTDGQQAEYDRFWDAYQENGQRTNYEYAFFRWSAAAFTPKYIIKPTSNAAMLLSNCKVTDRQYLDKIDLSQLVSGATNLFDTTEMPSFGVVDLSSVKSGTNVTNLFRYNSVIHTIDKIVVHEGIKITGWFINCSSLANVTFEGVIGQDGLNFSWSPLLTNESVQSVVDHLKDLTGSTTCTITFHADVGAKLTDEQKAAITAKNWTLAY